MPDCLVGSRPSRVFPIDFGELRPFASLRPYVKKNTVPAGMGDGDEGGRRQFVVGMVNMSYQGSGPYANKYDYLAVCIIYLTI